MLQVWTEKYRPKTLAEVKGQEDVTKRLVAFIKSGNMPHLLFAGPAGTGKTASAIAIARDLYGDTWRDNILELNASDERGIDIIRNKVKDFARSKAIEDVPFKIIYLDESDALTKEAQHALRRTMEDYTQNTRFILSCNYSSKIISPIQSRCAIFRFKPLPDEIIKNILGNIAKNEEIDINADALDLLYVACEGDCRRAENMLQACSAISKKVDKQIVSEIISFAEPKEIAQLIKDATSGEFEKAKSLMQNIMIKHGLSGIDMIRQIQKEVLNSYIDDKIKVKLIRACGEYEFRLVEGSDEFTQLAALISEFALISS